MDTPPLAVVPFNGRLWVITLDLAAPPDPDGVLLFLEHLEEAGYAVNYTEDHPDEAWVGGYPLERIA